LGSSLRPAALDVAPSSAALPGAAANSPAAADAATLAWVRIEVEDNGCGVSAADQARLFKEFVQIDAGVLQHGRGSGLGLYICHQIVARHGGRIGVTSTAAQGSIFFAELPLRVPAAGVRGDDASRALQAGSTPAMSSSSPPPPLPDNSRTASPQTDRDSPSLPGDGGLGQPAASTAAARTSAAASTAAGDSGSTPRPRRILVVDDSATNRTLLVRALARVIPGVELEEAGDGATAVALVQAAAPPFDVVCLDRMMPGLDGAATATALRAGGYTGAIIGVTGDVHPEDTEVFLANGVDAVVPKPVHMAQLLAVMHRVMRSRGMA